MTCAPPCSRSAPNVRTKLSQVGLTGEEFRRAHLGTFDERNQCTIKSICERFASGDRHAVDAYSTASIDGAEIGWRMFAAPLVDTTPSLTGLAEVYLARCIWPLPAYRPSIATDNLIANGWEWVGSGTQRIGPPTARNSRFVSSLTSLGVFCRLFQRR